MIEKSAIRLDYRKRRKAIASQDKIRASIAVANACFRLEKLRSAKQVAVYDPLDGELNTYPLICQLIENKKLVLLPEMNEEQDRLTFHQLDGGAELHPDLILVPLVAFDGRCHRLGFGRGWYDRTIAHLRALGAVFEAIGLAYEVQKADLLPIDAWDQPLDGVLTESGLHLPNGSVSV